MPYNASRAELHANPDTTAEWERIGYRDGLAGSGSGPPRPDVPTDGSGAYYLAYLRGDKAGRAARKATT